MSTAPASSGTEEQTKKNRSELPCPTHHTHPSVLLVPQSKSLSMAGKASLQPAPGVCTCAMVASAHEPGFLLPFINYTGIYRKLALMEVPMQLLCPVSHPGAKQGFAAALGLDAKGCSTFPWSRPLFLHEPSAPCCNALNHSAPHSDGLLGRRKLGSS